MKKGKINEFFNSNLKIRVTKSERERLESLQKEYQYSDLSSLLRDLITRKPLIKIKIINAESTKKLEFRNNFIRQIKGVAHNYNQIAKVIHASQKKNQNKDLIKYVSFLTAQTAEMLKLSKEFIVKYKEIV